MDMQQKADHAQRMQKINQVISAGAAKQRKIYAGLEREQQIEQQPLSREYSPDELSAMTMTRGQVDAVESVQSAARQILELINSINGVNLSYGLGVAPLTSFELDCYLLNLDERILKAGYAAKKMGVSEVVKKIGSLQAKQRVPQDERRAKEKVIKFVKQG